MALCHNGNLTNAIELRRQLENEGAIFHGSSDTEVICYLVTRNRLRMGSIEIGHQQDDGRPRRRLQPRGHVGHQAHRGP